MKDIAATKLPLKRELLHLLKKEIKLHSVYVISAYEEKKKQEIFLPSIEANPQKLVTYTLLIIGHQSPSESIGDFMENLYTKMQRRCRVYIIFYTFSKMKKRLTYGDNFLSMAVFQTKCIYQTDDFLSKSHNHPLLFHSSVYTRIQQTWEGRMKHAKHLLSSIRCAESKEDPIVMLSIMQSALEQICLGLLCMFWDFKPQYYSLSYMLHLCSHFSYLPQHIFRKEPYKLHRIYYMLCNAHHTMRSKAQNEFSEQDIKKAYRRCKWFYKEAKNSAENRLVYLNELHC